MSDASASCSAPASPACTSAGSPASNCPGGRLARGCSSPASVCSLDHIGVPVAPALFAISLAVTRPGGPLAGGWLREGDGRFDAHAAGGLGADTRGGGGGSAGAEAATCLDDGRLPTAALGADGARLVLADFHRRSLSCSASSGRVPLRPPGEGAVLLSPEFPPRMREMRDA
eukprot:scaffold6021_cov117-Isochrysis_galbana.AAC.4